MKFFWSLLWIGFLFSVIFFGANTLRNGFKYKFIRSHGQVLKLKIVDLQCSRELMLFHFNGRVVEKKIDARMCVLLNKEQDVKLIHHSKYADDFLFVNEQHRGLFILGGLELALGLFGLIANWPMIKRRPAYYKNFPKLSEN